MALIDHQITNGVHLLRLNDPANRNAMTDRMWQNLQEAVEVVRESPGTRARILTGSGSIFSAGGDVKRMHRVAAKAVAGVLDAETLELERTRQAHHHAIVSGWYSLDVPSVAIINGGAVGSGLALALSCDFRLMADDAWLDTGFGRIGLPGDCGITYFLKRLVGPAFAEQWLTRPARIGARDALELRLVDEVASRGALESRGAELAEEYANLSSEAVQSLRGPLSLRSLSRALDEELERTVLCKGTGNYAERLRSWVQTRDRI